MDWELPPQAAAVERPRQGQTCFEGHLMCRVACRAIAPATFRSVSTICWWQAVWWCW